MRSILRSPIYAGNLVGYKRIAANMKSKKRPSKLPEEWEVIPNTHEGIVTQEEFDIVQQLITSRRLPQNKGGFVNIFAGVIKCVDCGCALRAMNVHRRKRPEIIDCVQYSCNNYARNGRSECSAHNIEARDLFNAVLADINCFADMAVNDEKAVRAIEKRLTETDQSRAKALEKERKMCIRDRLKTKDLYPFPDNPFHVAEDETLSELAESIKEFGIVTPIITRPKEDGNGYEVIAGQRRVRASELAGINTIPAFVLPLDRDRAIITLVDSNLQRENILPSERAFAYKMKSEAMKRQGFRTDLTSSQVVTKLRTDDKVAQGFGVGRMTVQRFIRLTELIPPILQMVDEGKIALTPAVELSFLKKDEQENLFATMESEEATPSLSQAQRMKSLSQSRRLDMDTIFAIMTEEKGNQKETLKINTSKLKKYFPKNTTPKQMEETIIKLLERELQRKRNRDSR